MRSEEPEPVRPAMVTLSEDVRELVDELRRGLESEDRVLVWLQEITVRTLGRVPERVYEQLGRQWRGSQGVLLASLLRPAKRRGDMEDLEESVAERIREHLLASYIAPAHRDAFRDLRTDATEYTEGASENDAHDPRQQTFIGMRPALSELDDWQGRALERLLDGFDARGDVLDWGHDALLACHGELDQDWITRAYREESTVSILVGDSPTDARARRLFAAVHLIPRYRDGVRVLGGRAGEVPHEGTERMEVEFA